MGIFKYYEDDAKEIADTAREQKISELEILRQSLEDKKKEAADYYDQLLRLKADFENFRRRADKEKRAFLDWGREKILVKQIALSDVLEQALKSAEGGVNAKDILVGLTMINKEFSKMLVEEGVEEIELKKFDPNVCEALDFEQTTEFEDGTILAVYQKGYRLNGNLIRTAKVKVAKNEAIADKEPPIVNGKAGDESPSGKCCKSENHDDGYPAQAGDENPSNKCCKSENHDDDCPAQADAQAADGSPVNECCKAENFEKGCPAQADAQAADGSPVNECCKAENVEKGCTAQAACGKCGHDEDEQTRPEKE